MKGAKKSKQQEATKPVHEVDTKSGKTESNLSDKPISSRISKRTEKKSEVNSGVNKFLFFNEIIKVFLFFK